MIHKKQRIFVGVAFISLLCGYLASRLDVSNGPCVANSLKACLKLCLASLEASEGPRLEQQDRCITKCTDGCSEASTRTYPAESAEYQELKRQYEQLKAQIETVPRPGNREEGGSLQSEPLAPTYSEGGYPPYEPELPNTDAPAVHGAVNKSHEPCSGTARTGRFSGMSCSIAYTTVRKEDGASNANRWCLSMVGCEFDTPGLGYQLVLANRGAGALAEEAATSCTSSCQFPISGLALSPPQKKYAFEGHDPKTTGGYSQQTHPARAVVEIMKSGAQMSMQAVDIGASGGNPECGPLFSGSEMTAGKRWGGMQVDPRDLSVYKNVVNVKAAAKPPTIGKILSDNCIPKDLDILKIDIDCYDYEVAEAILKAGFRPKVIPQVFAAEVSISFPPPIHMHVKYSSDYQWSLISSRPKGQQILAGASVSAYSDLLRPLGYTLLNVDYYNVNFVQTKYISLFGNIPTDDVHAWRVGWFDRPERTTQKDLQKYWINHPPHDNWVKISDDEERFDAVLAAVTADNGPGGTIETHRDGYTPWVNGSLQAAESAAQGSTLTPAACDRSFWHSLG